MSDQDLIHRWLSQAELEQMLNDAYAKGADAMREAAAEYVKHASHEDGLGMGSQRMESGIRALPVPGKKP
jgi:predicted metalloprotease